jgi:hypothetical protein
MRPKYLGLEDRLPVLCGTATAHLPARVLLLQAWANLANVDLIPFTEYALSLKRLADMIPSGDRTS